MRGNTVQHFILNILQCHVAFFLAITAFIAYPSLGSSLNHGAPAKFCVPTSSIDFDPFTPFRDPIRLFYLMPLTRSFISNDPYYPGVLSKWHFSPDGLTLSAEVNSTLKWGDGSPITSRDVALSIARGLKYREIGKRVWVTGTESITSPNWQHQSYSGIKLHNSNTFTLTFSSTMENMVGSLIEALSSNARQNRLWTVRIDSTEKNGPTEFLSSHPYKWDFSDPSKPKILADILGTQISLSASDNCQSSQFKIYSLGNASPADYSVARTGNEQALIAFINPKGPLQDINTRRQLARWLRHTFAVASNDGFRVIPAHFSSKEPGYSQLINWGTSSTPPSIKNLVIAKLTNYPNNSPIISALNKALSLHQITGTMYPYDPNLAPHIIIAGAKVDRGRQIWLQDSSQTPMYANTLKNYPKTFAALKAIGEKSSATLPLTPELLQSLDSAALEEQSIVPLARYHVAVFSDNKMPVSLEFDQTDSLIFKKRISNEKH